MSSEKTPLSFSVLEEAAHWFALLRSDAASDEDHAHWRHWFEARAEHRAAWAQVEAISRRFEAFQSQPERSAAATVLHANTHGRGPTRRQLLTGLLAGAGTGLLGWSALERGAPGWLAECAADYRTGIGEIRRFALAGGVTLWLNTDSALNIGESPHHLRLLAGEMLVDSAPRSSPLVIDTGQGRLSSPGGRFTVRVDDDITDLSVFSGAVDMHAAGARQSLRRGCARSFGRGGFGDERPASAARDAWTRGVLLAEDLPLRELLRELARYRPGRLAVAPEVAELRVIGGYPLRDTDRVLVMLEQSLPIRVRRILPWWVSVEARV